MAPPTFMDVDDAVEGADLVRCLSRHGLAAGLVRVPTGWRVEVQRLGEDPRSFFADLGVALATWDAIERSSRGRSIRRTPA